MSGIRIEIGAGELWDRLTILEIKLAHAVSAEQGLRIERELAVLKDARDALDLGGGGYATEVAELRAVNRALWITEDELRVCEARGEFGDRFIALARSVYRQNDHRARLKRRIDERHGSAFWEEKIYAPDARHS
ncbi:MAG: DUF6165 family protein [Polyangia bacterium]